MRHVKTFMIFVFLLPSIAFAGGESWLFRVKAIKEITPDRFILVLNPIESGKKFPLNCKPLIVHLRYDSAQWQQSGSKDITRVKHNKAISLLKKASKDQKPIRIGTMGEGFGFMGNQTSCEVQSRALSAIERNGADEIYSFFKWP